ncbi:DUF1456 family protein [Agaribacterium sp. ZY112]|uniref:DUF1456 family protein n=1 Tax=Agaribacterium sp. ZY112 TaxID=3233574 RepID=UPI003523A58F
MFYVNANGTWGSYTMTNNDVLRRLRYALDYNDEKMLKLFSLLGVEVKRAQLCSWMKSNDDDDYQSMQDRELAIFLNALIVDKRGAVEGGPPEPENRLNNNLILRKLKIAFKLQSEAMIDLIQLGGLKIGPHELSAFFRAKKHKHYRECKDQVLRRFLQGLQEKLRPKSEFVWPDLKK